MIVLTVYECIFGICISLLLRERRGTINRILTINVLIRTHIHGETYRNIMNRKFSNVNTSGYSPAALCTSVLLTIFERPVCIQWPRRDGTA
jgi:hypothetical protein